VSEKVATGPVKDVPAAAEKTSGEPLSASASVIVPVVVAVAVPVPGETSEIVTVAVNVPSSA
jgi:hypothetical protein